VCSRALFFLPARFSSPHEPYPEGVHHKRPIFPFCRLALVKPDWRVNVVDFVNSPAALMRMTLGTERQWILR
jgi:hypothetical protein